MGVFARANRALRSRFFLKVEKTPFKKRAPLQSLTQKQLHKKSSKLNKFGTFLIKICF